MDFLSVLQGGEVLERYVLGVSESNGHLGAEIGFEQLGLPASVKAGAQKRKSLEEKVQFTTTAHSGFAEIIRALEAAGERRVINKQDDVDELTHNQLIELPYRRVRRLDPEEEPEGKRDERVWFAKLLGDESKPPVEFSAVLDTEVGPAAIVGNGGFLLVGWPTTLRAPLRHGGGPSRNSRSGPGSRLQLSRQAGPPRRHRMHRARRSLSRRQAPTVPGLHIQVAPGGSILTGPR
ncbi:MAG TPA: hypothetical protein VFY04_12230 [Solirubrobacterales bacterium]|nr:hypothetical protein [Solirubrobacterales bacterium]